MRNSIYISKHPTELRADLLLEYSKQDGEVWSNVPCGNQRWNRLDSVCEDAAKQLDLPGVFGIVNYYDVLGGPNDVFLHGKLAPGNIQPIYSFCDISMPMTLLKQRRARDSECMKCAAMLLEKIESAYKSSWIVKVRRISDYMYVKVGLDGDCPKSGLEAFDSAKVMPGNDVKFLCNCGQFNGLQTFKSKCRFAIRQDGVVETGFYYNDSGHGCHDRISLGNGRFFQNMGYVDRGYVAHKHSGYSYYVRARNIDEKKVVVRPRLGHSDDGIYVPVNAFHSIEEFAVERSLAGGLKPGDACYLYCEVVDPEGESRSVSDIACWDGSKWIDYYRETEIENWPALQAGWRKDDQNN